VDEWHGWSQCDIKYSIIPAKVGAWAELGNIVICLGMQCLIEEIHGRKKEVEG